MERYLIGLDAGTTSFKAALYDEARRLRAVRQQNYVLDTRGIYVEYDPEQYFQMAVSLIEGLLSESGVPAESVAALAVSSQGETLICLDELGQPLCPAIVWLDNRSDREAEELKERFGTQTVYEITGQADMIATWPATKILWLRRRRPALFERTRRFLLLEDYLLYRLTGQYAGEWNLWASSAMIHVADGSWWREMLEALDVSPDRLPRLLPSGAAVAPVRAGVCALTPRTLAVTGALDQTCSAIGAGVTQPGKIMVTLGSCLAVGTTAPRMLPYVEPNPATCQNHAVAGRYTVLLWAQSAGMTLKWFAQKFYPEYGDDLSRAFEQMDREAAQVPSGCEGLTMLPHLTGAGNPEHDSYATGVFFGITLRHGRAHFTRAVLEAVAYMLRRNLDQLARYGIPVNELYCSGGGAGSALWLSILASAAGKPIYRIEVKESGCLGAAILAGVGAGLFPGVDDAAELPAGNAVLPVPAWEAACERGYAMYCALYDALKQPFLQRAAIAEEERRLGGDNRT